MKICWDNLENVYLSNRGNFRNSNGTLVYKESCSVCGEPYLAYPHSKGTTCCRKCASSSKHNGFYGKSHTIETRELFSKLASYRVGSANPNFKYGLWTENLPLYDTYESYLLGIDPIRRNKYRDYILEIKCAYCGKWFIPKRTLLDYRIKIINGVSSRGENRLYCSDGCKKSCPIFNQRKFPKGFKRATSREVQPELRQLVFERDNYTCQKCGDNNILHCHHIESVSHNPVESADIDNCITLCKKCHKEIHRRKGCKYYELRCNGGNNGSE